MSENIKYGIKKIKSLNNILSTNLPGGSIYKFCLNFQSAEWDSGDTFVLKIHT
jgi:hypothetical protein